MAAMKLRFWGVRGSRPTHKKQLLGYGGNSTSLQFVLPDEEFYVFLDGGSGLAHCGREFSESPEYQRFYFLMTHTHWDHILGFPFFMPLYSADNSMIFYASQPSKATFNQLFVGLQRAANLPVPVNQLRADIDFESITPGKPFSIEGKVRVNTHQINHQGITLAYRVEYQKDSVAVITDNAPIENGNYLGEGMAASALGNEKSFEKGFNDGLIAFLKDCHTVVFDTHFTEENLKPDWGHSTPERALDFCAKAGVKRLILFHHAPEDVDQSVDDKVQSVVNDGKKRGVEVVAAREGDEWTLR